MIAIGRIEAADRAAWNTLFTGYNVFYGRTPDQAFLDHAWSRFEPDTDLHALGAKVDGELVGIAHFFTHPSTTGPDVCYLQDLFTSEAARGKGVGRALIAAIADWARDRGCGRLYWLTREDNTTARRLYDQVAVNKGFIQYQIPLEG
ncbi:MAG TPA: GNAT family N-acetyltransferase [Pseudonocardiaceae bacterium]|jgi:GNAT superfamily N-acetyltransferase